MQLMGPQFPSFSPVPGLGRNTGNAACCGGSAKVCFCGSASQAPRFGNASDNPITTHDLSAETNDVGVNPDVFDKLQPVAQQGEPVDAAQFPILAQLVAQGGKAVADIQADTRRVADEAARVLFPHSWPKTEPPQKPIDIAAIEARCLADLDAEAKRRPAYEGPILFPPSSPAATQQS